MKDYDALNQRRPEVTLSTGQDNNLALPNNFSFSTVSQKISYKKESVDKQSKRGEKPLRMERSPSMKIRRLWIF
ncbi:unnamed protein product [Larinioides sclopetarius]|uniref:Uncharacterized protein n=1 Tax=Larinioides sclopetarius TaxID=280406 RepID=A0AAV1ZZ42_9ARAC